MAIANTWARGHTSVSMPQQRPSSSSSSSLLNKNPFLRPLNKSSKLHCYCINGYDDAHSLPSSSSSSSSANWDWNRWTHHFSDIEQAESCASVLKFQLEEAIEKEDFHEAAKLKTAIAEATSKDSIAEIMSQLKSAINDEHYHEASRLCRSTGSGLIGWWVAYSKDSDDPFGRIIHIMPGMGRFVGRNYSPRQLVTASPGTPLFEIFVVKEDDDNTYTMQVVYLQKMRGSKENASSASKSKPTEGQSDTIIEDNAEVIDVKVKENGTEEDEEKNKDSGGVAEEGIKSVINFLKDKIPELKVKVMNFKITDEVTEDGETVKEVAENDEGNTISSENAEEESDSDVAEDEKDQDMKLFISGVLHNRDNNPTKDEYVRIPATIEDMERDSFMLCIPRRSQEYDNKEDIVPSVDVAAVVAQGVSELMPPDVAKAFLSSDKISPKVSKEVREMVKLAVKQAQKRHTLSEYTTFSRITTSGGDLDPFDGLYVGAFGPHGTEVVQLRRKYGNWNVENAEGSTNVEFYEYVEAVKLTGDQNVPAGEVTFRAKIGKRSRLSDRGLYPDELGVVASYKGEGRIANFGFRNPRWVEGELLQFNGKRLGPYVKGADLGFLYVVPGQSFLVLFNRLKLPE